MKEVRMTASNVMLIPTPEHKLQPAAELIIGVAEMQYFEEGEELKRERRLEVIRLGVNKPIIASLIKNLVELGEAMDQLEEEYNPKA